MQATLTDLLYAVQPIAAVVVIACGVWYLWRGLWGTTSAGALLRRSATALQRMEGFRAATFGLVLVGLGLGWLLGSTLLTVLALGIGIAELRESTLIIDAVRFRPEARRPRQRLV